LKDCKGERTVYEEYKVKKAQVANVETLVAPTAKTEEAKEEKDFVKSN